MDINKMETTPNGSDLTPSAPAADVKARAQNSGQALMRHDLERPPRLPPDPQEDFSFAQINAPFPPGTARREGGVGVHLQYGPVFQSYRARFSAALTYVLDQHLDLK